MTIAFVYKFHLKNDTSTNCYIGVTKSLNARKIKFRADYVNDKMINIKLKNFIKDNGGFKQFDIISLEKIEYDDKSELLERKL